MCTHHFEPCAQYPKVTESNSVNEHEGTLPLEKHLSYVLGCFVIDLTYSAENTAYSGGDIIILNERKTRETSQICKGTDFMLL